MKKITIEVPDNFQMFYGALIWWDVHTSPYTLYWCDGERSFTTPVDPDDDFYHAVEKLAIEINKVYDDKIPLTRFIREDDF